MLNIFKKKKKDKNRISVDTHTIKWYPNSQSGISPDANQTKPAQLPPLMVRKAAWRR